MNFRYYFILIFIFSFFDCSKAKEYTEQALEYEKKFQKMEAIYFYSKALEEDSDYFLANKNLGIMLSKSNESIDVSISHLEKAFLKNDKDIEISFLIYDLVLVNHDFKKLKSIRNVLLKNLDQGQKEILTSLENCNLNVEESKKMISKIESIQHSELEFFFHRSLAFCYGLADEMGKKSALLEKYEE